MKRKIEEVVVESQSIYLVRTYAIEPSNPRSSVIYHRTLTLNELDNYRWILGL